VLAFLVAGRELAPDCRVARNTLTAVYDSGTEVGRYDYDQNLQRVKRKTSSENVEYVLDDRFVLQETDGSTTGHPSRRRYHYGTEALAVTDGGTATQYITNDALGSLADLTTSGGTVGQARQYDAWGKYRNDSAPAANQPKLGYTGHQYDPETGLVYARARYYDPDVGVFLSRDSLEGDTGDAPSLHRYMYVRGNPVRYTDADGHEISTCTTPTGAPQCAAAAGEGASAAGTGSGAVATGAQTSATTAAGAGESAVATGVQTSAGTAEAVTGTVESATPVPWWKSAAAAVVGVFIHDSPPKSPDEMTPEERKAAQQQAHDNLVQSLQQTKDRAKVVLEGQDGDTKVVPVKEPGSPEPVAAPGADQDTGKVVTDPSTGQPMVAPGKGGTPLVTPGTKSDERVLAVADVWSPGKVNDPKKNAEAHWVKHKAEFPEYQGKVEYIEGARTFLNNPPSTALTKVRASGEVVVYDPRTNTLGIRRPDGTPITLFRPDPAKHGYPTNLDYFNAQ
jgi:RHS repeat-associated protein